MKLRSYCTDTFHAISVSLLMTFGNGGETSLMNWSSDHVKVRAFATDGTNVVAVAPMAESGTAVPVLDAEDGHFLFACPQAHGTGTREVKADYADGRYYFVRDGFSAPDDAWRITLSVHDAGTGKVVRFPGNRDFAILETKVEGNVRKLDHRRLNIRNFSTRERILLDVWVEGGVVWVETSFSGVRGYDPATGAFVRTGQPRVRPPLPPAVARHVVAPYTGAYDPAKLVRPVAWLTDAKGRIWVAEDRWNPKRITCWNPDGTLRFEKVGSPAYGASSAGFNTDDASLWVADNVLYHVDFERKTAHPFAITRKENVRVAGVEAARSYRFFTVEGRRLALGSHGVVTLSEVARDGTFIDRALISTVDVFERFIVFPDQELFPALHARHGFDTPADRKARPLVWRDLNGDGALQVEETWTAPKGWMMLWDRWGAVSETPDVPILLRDPAGKLFRTALSAAANWDAEAAFRQLVPIAGELPASLTSHLNDGYLADDLGNVYVESDDIVAIGADGRVRWTYPNPHRGVHGSHDGPFPRPGVMCGVIYAQGAAPLSDGRRVIAWQGNHGPVYFMDSNGSFLGSLFRDCRVSERLGPEVLGGEPFGGTFGYDRKGNRFLLQAGHGPYRIYQVDGLETAKPMKLAPDASTVVPPPTEVTLTATGENRLGIWGRTPGEIELYARQDPTNVTFRTVVRDASPWINGGSDDTLLFKTGDSFNLHFGNRRLLIAPFGKSIASVLYSFEADADEPVGRAPRARRPVDFKSPWRTVRVPDVRRIDAETQAHVSRKNGAWQLTFTLPRSYLTEAVRADGTVAVDFGVIFGDAGGTVNLARTYLFNRSTGLVNDVPGEIIPDYQRYGRLRFAAAGAGCEYCPQGPTYDAARQRIYLETSDGVISSVDTNGVLCASWPMGTKRNWRLPSPLVLDGKNLYFVRDRRLRVLDVTAPDGTPAELVKTRAGLVDQISGSVRDGELLAVRFVEKDLVAINLATGTFRVVSKWAMERPRVIARTDDGGVVFVDRTAEKVLHGQRLIGDGWPKTLIGRREMGFTTGCLEGDRFYLSAYHTTVRAFDAKTLEPSPGVVLGGKSGHFIGTAYEQPELITPGCIRHIAGNVYVTSGEAGVPYLLHFDPATTRFEIGRRLADIDCSRKPKFGS